MQQVNVHQAKTQLSKLLEQVIAGEEIIIARNGKPVARLSPLNGVMPARAPGALRGKIWIADNFNDFDKELENLFYGEGEPGE